MVVHMFSKIKIIIYTILEYGLTVRNGSFCRVNKCSFTSKPVVAPEKKAGAPVLPKYQQRAVSKNFNWQSYRIGQKQN